MGRVYRYFTRIIVTMWVVAGVSAMSPSAAVSATLWPSTAVPAVINGGADSPVELGVKFRSDTNGSISGIRFYKAPTNSGPHTGRLWSSSGALLATATFSGETASGWQQANFSSPVAISANTIYIASYHTNVGHYSVNQNYFSISGTDNPPLHAPANGVSGPNGVYGYGPAGTFPNSGWNATNYWVDVVFSTASGSDTVAPTVNTFTIPATSSTLAVPITALSATDNTAVTGYMVTESSTAPLASDAGWSVNAPTSYTFGSPGSKTLHAWAKDAAGNVSVSKSAAVTVTLPVPTGATIWPSTAVPAVINGGADSPVELGVKFRSDTNGSISGIRFYKAATNSGPHTGRLWSSSGTLLATATFSGETASGWQQANFSSPVAISANTIYIASYHTNVGHYSVNQNYFSISGTDNPPLHAPANGVSGPNGVYGYGPAGTFPNSGWNATNYWVDVVFSTSSGSDTVAPTVNTFTIPATSSTLAVPITALSATDNTAVTGYLVTESSTAPLASDAGWSVNAPTSYTFGSPGSKTLHAWAKDAAGNVSVSKSAAVTVTLPVPSGVTIWPSTAVPANLDFGADDPVELGVKFKSDTGGSISGIRFYKSAANTGPHTGRLWSSSGTLLATATFSGETASGWQQASFPTPVAISANTVYVASYHVSAGHYSYNQNYFSAGGTDNPPLHALADGVSGSNGVFGYGPAGTFPNSGLNGTNYWVDVVYSTASGSDTVAPTVNTFTIPATSSTLAVPITALNATDDTAVTGYLVTESSTAPLASDAGWSVNAPTSYTFGSPGSKTLHAWAKDAAGNVSVSKSAAVTVTLPVPSGVTIWPSTAVPANLDFGADDPVELGVKFKSDTGGSISGIRFYKSAANTGPHTGRLWSSSGTLLATATFSGETASGWQQASFPTPVAISANTVYVASYHVSAGHYSYNQNYFSAGGTDNPPLHALADGVSGSNGVFGYGPAGTFPNSGLNGTNYWLDVVYSTASGSDTVAPTVNTFTIPATSSTLAVPITALNATDDTAVTGYLVTESSTAPLASDAGWSVNAPTSYTFGSPGSKTLHAWAKDAAGNVSTSKSAAVTVTLSVPSGVTIWPTTAVPAIIDGGADSPVELGVKFRSDTGGSISGIRYYKSAANTGPHTGRLWSSSGALLATATFSGETASGWQQASFPTPVAISANTVYIASYHTNVGHYSFNQNYFSGSGADNPPLHALAEVASSANGVFGYGPAGTYPNSGWQGTNYWIDVVFSTASGSDAVAPTVTSFTIPVSSATLTVPITAFNASDNIGVTGYLVTESSTPPLAGDSDWSVNAPTSYTFAAPGNKTLYAWARDAAGNVSTSKSASVTISVSAASGQILLISSAGNPFSGYLAEILRAEGFTFNQSDISTVTSATLAAHELAILGEMALTTSQVTMFENWVNGGGNFIAMRPDKKLAALLGLLDNASSISNKYLRVNTSGAPGAGIVDQTMQYHGAADLYGLNGAAGVANLYSSASSATSNPAVTLRSVGTNGGQAAAFTYDLARSVVYTRQGNPAWSGQERDGDTVIRSDDLFYGPASFDPQPNWIDLDKVAIPQADEQQRLLANLIIHMNQNRKPLPRFWYLPRNLPAAIVMTGDDHGIGYGGTRGRFNYYQSISSPGCSVENWECIRGSSYLYTGNTITDDQASTLDSAGFEIGLHVNTNCANWTPSSLDIFYTDQLAGFSARFPGLPDPVTHRTHCIAWSDYASQSTVELNHGIRLDTSYYYWPAHWVANNPGFFTGSGMAMRFAHADGTTIDAYQAATQMTDESGQTYPFTVDALLDRATGPEGFYGAFVVNAHTDFDTSSVSDAVVQSAQQRGIPVISARQLLTWLNGRNESKFSALSWNGTSLGFTVTAAAGSTGLIAMVPVPEGRTVSSVTRSGSPVSFSAALIKGVKYARFAATGGDYQVTYGSDTVPPEIVNVTPARDARDVILSANITATFSEPVNPGTIHENSFVLRNSSSAIVPATVEYNSASNTAILTPSTSLAGGTTYTATVSGEVRDLAGNSLGGSVAWSFTTAPASSGLRTIWSTSAVPATVDSGPDAPVELGVKFRSDKGGYIYGIRFYKSATNTGTHVANLWTADGTRMATATFSGESSSGWQQVNFTTPVAITANTVYVASYHTNAGHYSFNTGYFKGKGEDNPPLHALANGVSGFNGVYAYGSTSAFPNEGWEESNYWVDVVFSETSPQHIIGGASLDGSPQSTEPVLSMIKVMPDNQRIAVGTTQQFVATAIYSDGSTKDVSGQVAWTSSTPEIATVSSSGLVTAHGVGICTISATLDGITGSTSSTATDGMARIAPAPGSKSSTHTGGDNV